MTMTELPATKANDQHLRKADRGDGKSATERGYSHGALKGYKRTDHAGDFTWVDAALSGRPKPRSFDPNSLMNGWSPEARASYSVVLRADAAWADQQWKRVQRILAQPPRPWVRCTVCGAIIPGAQRRTRKYCSDAHRQFASRARSVTVRPSAH